MAMKFDPLIGIILALVAIGALLAIFFLWKSEVILELVKKLVVR